MSWLTLHNTLFNIIYIMRTVRSVYSGLASAATPTLWLLLDLPTYIRLSAFSSHSGIASEYPTCLLPGVANQAAGGLIPRQAICSPSSMLGAECRTGIIAAPRIGYPHQLRHSSILLRLGRPTANDATWQPRSVDVWLYARAARPPQPRGWPQPRSD